MNDMQEYNALLPSVFADETQQEQIAEQKDQEAEQTKQEWSDPADLLGAELLKGSLEKGVKTIGKKLGKKAVEQVGKTITDKTGYDVSKIAKRVGEGDFEGAVNETGKAVTKQVGAGLQDVKGQFTRRLKQSQGKPQASQTATDEAGEDTEKIGRSEISSRYRQLR